MRTLSRCVGSRRPLWILAAGALVLAVGSSCQTHGGQPPDGSIDEPSSGRVIAVGEAVDFAGSGVDPEAHYPLKFTWSFGEGSGVPDSLLEDPGPVVFPNAGTFVVSLRTVDFFGRPDPTPATVTVVVQPPPQLVDNGDPGFTATPGWATSDSLPGHYGDDFVAIGGQGGEYATWSLPVAEPGEYAISAWWPAYERADRAVPYRIRQGGLDLLSTRLDQRTAGSRFNHVGTVTLAAGTVELLVENDIPCCGYVLGDAVQIGQTTLAFTAPRFNALTSISDVPVTLKALGFPAGWGAEVVVDGTEPGVIVTGSELGTTLAGLPEAEHVVTAYLVDELGRRVPGVSTTLEFGVGAFLVGFGDSITAGEGDDVQSDDASADHRNTSAGYQPILNDLLTVRRGIPHTVESASAAGVRSYQGIPRMAQALLDFPEAELFLILLGTNDAFWEQTPSGVGLQPEDPGYGGSYKDHMRQILDLVVAAGKQAALAKLPPITSNLGIVPTSPAVMTQFVQEYNQVIDELVIEYGLPPAPDFYAYFAANPGELADGVHPTSVGYQEMALRWADALEPLAP